MGVVRAGALSERIAILTPTAAADGRGGFSTTWATLATVWAQPLPQSAREQQQAESVGSHGIYQFVIRVRAGVTAAQRVTWTPRYPSGMTAMTLEINGVQPTPQRDGLVLTCAVVQ